MQFSLSAAQSRSSRTGSRLTLSRWGRSTLADQSCERARLAEGGPQGRRLLDQALGPPIGGDQRNHRRAAEGGGGEIVVEPELGVRPIALVGLVADGEIEMA